MILDVLYPRRCVVCGFWGGYICLACQKKLRYIRNDFCFYCEKTSVCGLTDESCGRRNEIDGYMAIFLYNNVLRSIVKGVKYRFAYDMFRELFLLIDPLMVARYAQFVRLYPNAVLQPIPLHLTRQNWRGFNQAAIVTSFFQAITAYPIVNILHRAKDTLPQAQVRHRVERYYNMRRAFTISSPCPLPHEVVLVDDIVTTGNTIKEAVHALKQAGVAKVFVFSLARG